MCGIAGFYQLDGRQIRLDDLLRMRDVLTHRGPDACGHVLLDTSREISGSEQEGDLGLAHRRLSILDLSKRGAQPMSNSDGTMWLVYNGEIYNFRDIRRELVRLGYSFVSECDTEVVIKAFEEWGAECAQRFVGMFAFAVWDVHQQTLYLVRDRLGIKPLYYYLDDGAFAFASELKGLLEYPKFRKDLDLEGLAWYLRYQYVPAPRSIFARTSKLEPGHYLTICRRAGCEVHSYWDPVEKLRDAAVPQAPLARDDAMRQLDGLLCEAVEGRLISDVPIGVLLSGGVDSSLVTAIMQRVSSRPVQSFTIGFYEEGFDEAPYGREIASHLGTQHHELYVTPRDAIRAAEEIPALYDEPFADSSAIPTYLVSRLARGEITVALSGDGGDELFGGYKRYDWVRFLQRLGRLPYGLRRTIAAAVERVPEGVLSAAYGALGRFLPGGAGGIRIAGNRNRIAQTLAYRSPLELHSSLMGLWDLQRLRRLLAFDFPEQLDVAADVYRELPDFDPLTIFMMADLKTYLVDDILTKVDRASMAVSLEVRVPLLDHRVVEWALGSPAQRRYQKDLLKGLLSAYLPPALFERPKHGFSIPLEEWLRGDLLPMLRHYLDGRRIARQGLFDVGEIQRTMGEYLKGDRRHWHRLWALIVFEMWYERYG